MNRTIRGKLQWGLFLVFMAIFFLAGSGVWGLHSYHRVIRDFDAAINRAPHQPDLVDAVAALLAPLRLDAPAQVKSPRDYEQFALAQVRQFNERLESSRQRIEDFHRKLAQMQTQEIQTGRFIVAGPLLSRIQIMLQTLHGDAEILKDWQNNKLRISMLQKMRSDIAEMLELARKVPDPVDGLNPELNRARRDFFWSFWIIVFAGSSAIIILFGLRMFGHRFLFVPIHKLYESVRRMETRLDTPDLDFPCVINTKDEVAELANAFGDMVKRFKDIRDSLDQQVKERSRQLVRSERLAGVGFLASGIAHEINNPLSAVLMAADSLVERLHSSQGHLEAGDFEVVKQYLQMIQRETERCREITGRLLDFARGQDSPRLRTDVAGIVREVLEMVGHLSKFRDRKIIFEHERPCYLTVHPGEIKQVILNLTANALDSMNGPGTLMIQIHEMTDEVVISFKDDGCGMTPEVINDLFEPFFTTKEVGKGTGLGLSISHRIIEDHQGTIEAESEGPGKGSTFSIRLPRKASGQTKAA
ncbi:MAG: HAMP domain-containing sensor histidine kinase [Planctomycetales bacterium]